MLCSGTFKTRSICAMNLASITIKYDSLAPCAICSSMITMNSLMEWRVLRLACNQYVAGFPIHSASAQVSSRLIYLKRNFHEVITNNEFSKHSQIVVSSEVWPLCFQWCLGLSLIVRKILLSLFKIKKLLLRLKRNVLMSAFTLLFLNILHKLWATFIFWNGLTQRILL